MYISVFFYKIEINLHKYCILMTIFPDSYQIYECAYFKSRTTGLIISYTPTKREVRDYKDETTCEKKYNQYISKEMKRMRNDPNIIVTGDMFKPYIPYNPDYKHMAIGLPGNRSDELLKFDSFDNCWIWCGNGERERFDDRTEKMNRLFSKLESDKIDSSMIAYIHHLLGGHCRAGRKHGVSIEETKHAVKFVKERIIEHNILYLGAEKLTELINVEYFELNNTT